MFSCVASRFGREGESLRHAPWPVIGLKLLEYSLQITPGIALQCFKPLTTLLNFNNVQMCLHLAAITLTVHRFVASCEAHTQIDLPDYLLSSYCLSVTVVV